MPETPTFRVKLNPVATAFDIAVREFEKIKEQAECFDQWVTLSSSNLDKFFYDTSTQELTIEFHGARQYKYFSVSPEMAGELCRAPAQRL